MAPSTPDDETKITAADEAYEANWRIWRRDQAWSNISKVCLGITFTVTVSAGLAAILGTLFSVRDPALHTVFLMLTSVAVPSVLLAMVAEVIYRIQCRRHEMPPPADPE